MKDRNGSVSELEVVSEHGEVVLHSEILKAELSLHISGFQDAECIWMAFYGLVFLPSLVFYVNAHLSEDICEQVD